jgi:preprotein translocase subunit SecD
VDPAPRPKRKGPRKLSPHRMALALALVSTAPPLIMRYGWPGVLAAIAAVAYAVYLIGGKKWPWSR